MYLEEWRDSTRRMQMKASLIPSTGRKLDMHVAVMISSLSSP